MSGTEPDAPGDEADEGAVVSPRDGVLGPGPGPRRHPSTRGGMLYLLVLVVTVVGVALVVLVDWRVGVRVEGAALIAAAGLRLALPERDAGMLAVRNRYFDAALVVLMGVVLIVLAGSIPDQPSPL